MVTWRDWSLGVKVLLVELNGNLDPGSLENPGSLSNGVQEAIWATCACLCTIRNLVPRTDISNITNTISYSTRLILN